MGRLLDIVTPLHKATKRDYLARMNDDKVHCMVKAKEYEFDYWDGDRRYGYGGLKDHVGRVETGGAGPDRHLRSQGRIERARRRLRQGVPALRDEENSAGPQDRRFRHLK